MYNSGGIVTVAVLLVLLVSFSSAQLSCPKDFQCGRYGNLSFPFSELSQPNCGFFIANCSNQTSPTVSLVHQEEQRWYDIKSTLQANSIRLFDPQFHAGTLCCWLFNWNMIQQQNYNDISFTILSNITLFRCVNETDSSSRQQEVIMKYFQNYTAYEMCHDFTVFYRNPKADTATLPLPPSLPSQCKPITLPMVPLENITEQAQLFDLLTADFDLNWNVTEKCVQCFREGQCHVNNNSFCTKPEDKHPWPKSLIGVCMLVLIVALIGGVWFRCYLRNKQSRCSTSNIKGALRNLPGSPKEYDYRELRKATNNFNAKNKLGQGGFGAVYKGLLPSENLEIAVKCFFRENINAQDDSLAELTIINRLRHRHLVRLLGWCHKKGKLLLIYEYMPNGSLDQHLFAGPDKPPLDWNLRYKIISGVASALHYLHNDYDERVVHRDLKASNIMLDSNFNARLGDFGLARVLENDKTSYMQAEGVAGTIGYIAPECFHTGTATQQSDVYAFGTVLLEVVCGLRPGTKISRFMFLVDWVWYLHRDRRLVEAVDPSLGAGYVAEEAERLLLLGLACSHPMANERPKTQAIVQMLSGTLPVPYVPPFKPAFVWHGTVSVDIDSSTADSTSLSS